MPSEKVLYSMALYAGTYVEEPDYLATVDVGPESSAYSQVVHRIPMPIVEDECTPSVGTLAAPVTATRASRAASL
jgi:hypothetical protein